jgi:hypothetical protein
MRKKICHFVPYILLCSAAAAQISNPQGTVRAGFSPVPIWPQNGIVPDTLRQQYVFLDPSTNEVVLSVPEDWTAPDNGIRKQVRFTLRNGTDPFVSVHVQPSAGRFTYQYSVGNGAHARQALDSFGLFVPADPRILTSHAVWKIDQIATSRSSQLPQPNPERLVELRWSASSAAAVPKNSSVYGFEVVSTAKPGFVTSVAEGRVEKLLPKSLAESLPEAAKVQLNEVLQPQWDGRLQLTLGPKFQPGTPQLIIAADFYTGIQRLTKRKILNATSPFVTSTLQMLDAFIQSGGQASLSAAAINTGSAQPGIEQEVSTALKLCLGQ